ncbi:hypothetical protein [Catenovulum sediminis]|uniref:Uncharacterized protein n=1 Tax=Catenovulum sediminis TaxID=1740262 RepID=A0ABV1RHH2_9ALTE
MQIENLAKELDLADVTQLLVAAVNRDAEEHDQLLIKLNDAELKLKSLEEENAKLRSIAEDSERAINNLEKRHHSLIEATEQAVSKKDFELSQARLELKSFKEYFGTLKKGREKIKRLQKANEGLNKKCEQLIRNNKQYSRENFELKKGAVNAQFGDSIVSHMQSLCWEHDEEYLMLFHRQMKRGVEGEHSPALLYVSPTGSASLLMLDGDEPVLSKQPRGGHKPKAATAKFARQWLNKVKSQGNTVKADDLNALKHNITDENQEAA